MKAVVELFEMKEARVRGTGDRVDLVIPLAHPAVLGFLGCRGVVSQRYWQQSHGTLKPCPYGDDASRLTWL